MDSCLDWPSICSADLLSRSPKWTGITGAIPIERKGVSVVFACILSISIFEWIEILETFNCPECFHTKHSDYKSSGDWTFPAELTNLKFHRFPGAKFCIIFAFSLVQLWENFNFHIFFTKPNLNRFQFGTMSRLKSFHWLRNCPWLLSYLPGNKLLCKTSNNS